LELEAAGSGSISTLTAIEVAKISAKNSGSGNINLSGGITGITELNALVAGTGSIQSFFLYTKNTNATILGSGNIECNVLANLNAKISGSGNVFYRGNPTVTGSGTPAKHVD
jgi:Putative auto-transporter adhesin, head GIN domain